MFTARVAPEHPVLRNWHRSVTLLYPTPSLSPGRDHPPSPQPKTKHGVQGGPYDCLLACWRPVLTLVPQDLLDKTRLKAAAPNESSVTEEKIQASSDIVSEASTVPPAVLKRSLKVSWVV